MKWQSETVTQPRVKHRMSFADGYLSVYEDDKDERRVQYLSMSFVEFSDAPIDDCLKTWPRKAIELARKALDDFEASLDDR